MEKVLKRVKMLKELIIVRQKLTEHPQICDENLFILSFLLSLLTQKIPKPAMSRIGLYSVF